MGNDTMANIRPLQPDDMERVVEIDTRITGRSRRKFYEKRLQAALANGKGFVTVGIEGAAGINGFAIARLQSGEYGNDQRVAVLDVLAVDPDARHDGAGQALLEAVSDILRKLEIGELRTQIDWLDQGLAHFFATAGFHLAPEQILERSVARNL